MGCDFPLKAYRTPEFNDSGRRGLTFNPLRAVNSTNPIEVPCGRCTGCRLERSRQWAVRMMHEAQLHQDNAFITLTYDDDNLPADYGLDLRHWQLFMKRLRKTVGKVRFYACGEYGEQLLRPHYHAILFGYQFRDLVHFKTQNQNSIFTSQLLSRLWPFGHSTTAAVSYQSAAYVARYTMKKISGELAAEHYLRRHPISGQLHTVRPEFSVMSRRPGIGADWLARYKSDVFPSGFIVAEGKKMPPPRFYTSKLSVEEQQALKRAARAAALPYKPHQTTERRRVRAAVRDARITRLKRPLEQT